MERLSPKTIFKTNISSFIGISLRPLPITFVPLTEEEEEKKKEGNCVEVEENEEDGEEQKDGKEDDAEEEGKDEAKEIGEEFVEKENIEECDLGEVVVVDENETTLKHKKEKTVEQNEKNNSDDKKEERENDEDESDEEVLELLYGDIDDTVKDNLPKDQQVKIVSNYPNSDDDDDEEEEGKLVISEDSDDEEDEMPAAKRAKVSDYTLEESKDKNESLTAATDKETAEDDNKTKPSEDVPEKAPAFGFRFVNECLDEEALEMEEAAILDGHKDTESHVDIENGEMDQNEVDSLEKEEENTMEENVEMSGKNEIQEVTEKLPEVIQKSEILLEDVEEDEISSESLSTRWQRNKRKRFVQKQRNLIKNDNSSSKRPRRSCQLAKDYFGK